MRTSPFAPVDKAAVLGSLRAVGSHDPDVLEKARTRLLAAARWPRAAGGALLCIGASLIFSPAGMWTGLPVAAVGTWLMQRGQRNAAAVRDGFDAFTNSPAGSR